MKGVYSGETVMKYLYEMPLTGCFNDNHTPLAGQPVAASTINEEIASP